MFEIPEKAARAEDDLAARLTEAAYGVALRHGLGGSFLDVQLEMWRAVRAVLRRDRVRMDAATCEEELCAR